MVLAEIGTAGVISAYFFRHMTSGYSLNVSDPIEGQPVQLSYYLCVFGCGLVFWLLVLLWAKLHDSGDRQADIRKVSKLAKLIAPITTLNLCGCLLVPFVKLPLLVRFLVLFQVSSNLALLLIWAFLSPPPEPVRMLEEVLEWLRNSEIIKISLTFSAQISVTLMAFNLIPTPSSSSKALLVVALMDQLVAYLCGVTGILLSSNKPEDSKAAKIFARIGFVCYTLGCILMVAMYAACCFVVLSYFLMFFLIFVAIFFVYSRKEPDIRLFIDKVKETVVYSRKEPDIRLFIDKEEETVVYSRKEPGIRLVIDIEEETGATEKLPPKGIGESHATWRSSCFERAEEGSVARNKATRVAVHNVDGVGGKVDEAGGSRSGHGSGASGSEENRGSYGGNDGGGGAGGGADRGASGSGHGSGASGSGGGSEGGDRDSDGGGDRGASGSGHGSGASGSGGGSEGGDRGRDGGGADPECGGRGTNTEQAFESSKIIKMSITLTAQTTGTLMGFHSIPTPSSSSKFLLIVALMDQLVAYLCGVSGILLSSNKPEAAKIFARIGFVCYTLGYILMIAMYVTMYLPWYSVLIVVLLFGVVWLILFRNGLKTRATEVWNYLKNSTQSIKNYIEMLFESGS